MDIKGLARHLNLSIGTVSRALNGERHVSAKTRERVVAAADELGYVPNQLGRNLRRGKTGIVTFMLPASGRMAVADTIFMMVIDGLRAALEGHDLDLMIMLCDMEDAGIGALRRVVDRGLADGVIIADIQRVDKRVEYLLKRKTPFAAFGRTAAGGPFPWIDLDFEGVAELAVERLAGKGHRRIALGTTANQINYGFVFEAAFRAAMERRNIPVGADLVFHVEDTEEGGYAFGDQILAMNEPPTAAIVANEIIGVGLYRRMFEDGLVPGRDLSLICFGEEPTARFLQPAPTHYVGDFRGLGVRLGEALLPLLPGREPATAPALVQEIWPMRLVPGESDAFLQPVRGRHGRHSR